MYIRGINAFYNLHLADYYAPFRVCPEFYYGVVVVSLLDHSHRVEVLHLLLRLEIFKELVFLEMHGR